MRRWKLVSQRASPRQWHLPRTWRRPAVLVTAKGACELFLVQVGERRPVCERLVRPGTDGRPIWCCLETKKRGVPLLGLNRKAIVLLASLLTLITSNLGLGAG
jgi:hypothetical protein